MPRSLLLLLASSALSLLHCFGLIAFLPMTYPSRFAKQLCWVWEMVSDSSVMPPYNSFDFLCCDG